MFVINIDKWKFRYLNSYCTEKISNSYNWAGFYLLRIIMVIMSFYFIFNFVIISFQVALLAVVGEVSSVVITDSATKPPLMFSKWPPTYQNSKSSSLRHQMFHQLRSSGRLPSPSMIVKRYPSQQMSVVMRPMKYPQLKKAPIPQTPYYKPTISPPPRYRFQSSASASNVGEYIFENPFNNLGLQSVSNPIDLKHMEWCNSPSILFTN